MRIENGAPPYPPSPNGKINEYSGRPVLPTPRRVQKLAEPVLLPPLSSEDLVVGFPVVGVVLPRSEWTKGGKPRFRIQRSEVEGHLHPRSTLAVEPAEGAEFPLSVAATDRDLKRFVFFLA